MELIISTDEESGSKIAYEILKETLLKNEQAVLGLATGTTPLKLYQLMIDDYQKRNMSYKNIKTYNLDEYVGLDENHPQSYRYFMNKILFEHLDIDLNNTFVPNGIGNQEVSVLEYDKLLKNLGPADIQILGIGSNGHIAFNEPGTDFNLMTHVTELSKSTIKDNSRLFNNINEVLTKAITMGIKSIMESKQIILMAFGKNKQEAIYQLLSGKIDNKFPASILNNHQNITVICDKEASSLLTEKKID